MDGENFMEKKTPIKMDDLGGPALFLETYYMLGVVVGSFFEPPIWKNMRTVKLDHETPGIGVKMSKNMWDATT